jgi:hypothetical protein
MVECLDPLCDEWREYVDLFTIRYLTMNTSCKDDANIAGDSAVGDQPADQKVDDLPASYVAGCVGNDD